MKYTPKEIAKLIDISAVRVDSTQADVREIIEGAKKYGFICVFSLPGFLPFVFDHLKEQSDIMIGGVIGFPSGGETTASKVAQAKELKALGVHEMDMVLNVGMLKSGMCEEVRADIKAVVKAAQGTPLKVIMEVPLLTKEEIIKASEIIRDTGASFIKTGTGWTGSTSMEDVKLIKETVGDAIPLKVAGGVRDLRTLVEMVDAGVSRFGIGYKAAIEIMEECIKQQ